MKLRTVMRKGRRVIKASAIYIFVVLMFIAGYICSDVYITKEITDEQYESCRETMQSIYMEGDTNLRNIPKDMYFDDRNRKIGFNGYFGYVQSDIENGKIIIKYEKDLALQRVINFSIACIGALLAIIFKELFTHIYKKVEKME